MPPTYFSQGPDQYGFYQIFIQLTDPVGNVYLQQVDNVDPTVLTNTIADIQAKLDAVNSVQGGQTLNTQISNHTPIKQVG